jgi:hypothetical protein
MFGSGFVGVNAVVYPFMFLPSGEGAIAAPSILKLPSASLLPSFDVLSVSVTSVPGATSVFGVAVSVPPEPSTGNSQVAPSIRLHRTQTGIGAQ